MGYKEIEGKLDAVNVLAAILSHNNNKYSIPAELVFSNIQVDRILELNYNEETRSFDIELKSSSEIRNEENLDHSNNE